MQAHPNAGQVLTLVDDARLPRSCLEQVVNAAQADRQAQHVQVAGAPPLAQFESILPF